MQETLNKLLSDPCKHVYKELGVDNDGNKVLDVRWFTQIIRVSVNDSGVIVHEEIFDYEDLYEIEIGWWNEDEYL